MCAAQIVERATKEDQIEAGLDKMTAAWNDVVLRIEPYRCVHVCGCASCVRRCVFALHPVRCDALVPLGRRMQLLC